MPIYAFVCRDCQHEFEELVSRMGASAACPSCGSQKVDRRLTVPADYRGAGDSVPEACQACDAPPGAPCGMGGCGL